MRRPLIFLTTIAVGGGLLWYFESKRVQRESSGAVSIEPIEPIEPIDGQTVPPTSIDDVPDGPEEGDAERPPWLKRGERISQGGELRFNRPHRVNDPESVRLDFVARDSQPLNETGTALRLLDIVAETYVWTRSVPPEDVVRTRVQARSTTLDAQNRPNDLTARTSIVEVDLEGVVIEQLRETPLAPLTVEAPRMHVHFIDEEFRSVEKDLVKFRSRDLRGWGRGLFADMQSGRVEFNDGADVTIDLRESFLAHIQTPEGGTLRIIEETSEEDRRAGAPRKLHVVARQGVRAVLRDDGTDVAEGDESARAPIMLDADSLDVWVEFSGEGERPRILSARADGAVRIERASDVYLGDTALFTFDELGEPAAVVLEDEPQLTYRIADETGAELVARVAGVGPLTAHFLGADDDRRIRFEFEGPGRIEAIDRDIDIRFQRSVHGEGVEGGDDVAATIDGDVRVLAPEGTLFSDALVMRQSPDGTVRVKSDSPTRLTHRDPAKGVDYRFVSRGGLRGRLVDDAWFLDEAESVIVESLGAEPFRVEAGRVEDVDVRAQTLRASTDITYQTAWGTAFAPVALIREREAVRLEGTPANPVRFDFTPEDLRLELEAAESMGVRTGWVEAPTLTLSRGGVLAEGNVAASIETLDGVFGIDCATLRVDRIVTGASFEDDPAAPVPAGALRARRAEDVHLEAVLVREARFDSGVTGVRFKADRLIVDAPLADAGGAEGEAGVDVGRETRFEALGDVDGRLEVFAEFDPAAPGVPRDVLQTMTFLMAETVLVRGAALDPTAAPEDAIHPVNLEGKAVERFVLQRDGRRYEVSCERLELDGDFGPDVAGVSAEGADPASPDDAVDLTGSSLVAEGDVDLAFEGGADEGRLNATGDSLVLIDGERGTLSADAGHLVRATGTLPGTGVPYLLDARKLSFDRTTLEGEAVKVKFSRSVATGSGFRIHRAIAPKMTASETLIVLSDSERDPVRAFSLDGKGLETELELGYIEIDPRRLKSKEEPQRSIGPREPVPAQDDERTRERQDPPVVVGGDRDLEITREDGLSITISPPRVVEGRTIADKLTAVLKGGELDIDLWGLVFDAAMLFGAGPDEDFLIEADRGVVRGRSEETGLPWSFEFASIDMEPIDDEILVTIVAPRVEYGEDHARADYVAFWIDRARWRAKVRNVMSNEPMPESFPGDDEAGAESTRPNFLGELLFEVQSQEGGRFIRALFMEGGVEIARADQRAAKGSRLYVGLDQGVAWLQDAELVYPLLTSGEEVPLRVRTERLETDESGRLIADGATLTTCDHDVPHFVVRTNQFRLEPRDDGRWRFNATGNRLRFDGGLQLPLPSIGNVVLDEDFGVQGFENEAGEVTPLRDIGIARTARFGTVLGAAFRFDIGSIGSWIGERIGMDTDKIRGKWSTQAQYLASRGPLLGFGLSLRERKPGDDPGEDFRLDAFVSGIPDEGEDRGTVRVPEFERDTERFFGYLRGRYPIVRGEWLEVAFASQTDAGVQPEFYEGEYLRFEQRDTFVWWRKSFGADYLTSTARKRVDDFRSQKEELPTFLAYRGERAIGAFGGAPVLWGGSFESGWYTRREGEPSRDLFSDLPGGAIRNFGNAETGRADLQQRLSLPLQTQLAGLRATPFVEGRATGWTDPLDEGEDPGRAGVKGGMELSTTFHKVTGDGYLHALAPRVSASGDAWYDDTGGTPIPLDQTEQPFDGTRYEAGLRAIWVRPRTFENLDFDLRVIRIQDRENSLPDTTQFGALAEWITRVGDGDGQVGMRIDTRYDFEDSRATYTRGALAWRPNERLLAELRYGQAVAADGVTDLFENGEVVLRTRLDPKWEIEGRYVQDLLDDQHLLTEVILRRFSHDFVFDIGFQDRTGEGGTNISFSLLPLLGWTRARLGMLDRR